MGQRRREQADAGGERRHQHRPHPLLGAVEHRLRDAHARSPQFPEIGDVEDAVHDGHAEQRDKSDRRRNAEIEPRGEQRDQPAADGKGDAGERQQAVAQRVEQTVEQHENQQQRDRHHDHQARFRGLQIVEFTGPDEAIASRKLDRLFHTLLRLRDRAAEISPAHAELDRDVALAPLAIDEGCAGIERDVGKLAQGNIGVGAGGRLVGHLDVTHRIDALAEFGIEPHRDAE